MVSLLIVWLMGSQLAGHAVAHLRVQTHQHSNALLSADVPSEELTGTDCIISVGLVLFTCCCLGAACSVQSSERTCPFCYITYGFILLMCGVTYSFTLHAFFRNGIMRALFEGKEINIWCKIGAIGMLAITVILAFGLLAYIGTIIINGIQGSCEHHDESGKMLEGEQKPVEKKDQPTSN
eukprot:gnl/TRDRNA2_/TRDRNA2_188378_c0_seq1.p1 gnl/TRDRNA2_/TRDRNA2_188378_c0~~gnl/TRDRNA2_/TRDRNA2_188378_c0_seq1.p1  ORF type:complete len:180 (-),score=16.99 gnl/TRDRNA2_/TRDRNA2_188378_c0_seq1:140-679(-)